ncbi:ABC transporter ATP-binding protein/permease [Escherichia coli]|uniref:hypothetical protein n=1 Tax=Escherichia coli TaxID=562 RepID=UPI000DA5C2E5|nr:ABC transporter ATP-binding protein/permease [Escherichia coli]SRY65400.1 ABC transporter ATP-binding protein/permease [Escherichia coli]
MRSFSQLWPTLKRLLAYGSPWRKPLGIAVLMMWVAAAAEVEHQILHNLRQWGQGRTVIISAHRLSALTEASEIIVMQHGHIAQRGNHDVLAQQSGWYRDMYRYQQLEAALDDAPENREEAVDA